MVLDWRAKTAVNGPARTQVKLHGEMREEMPKNEIETFVQRAAALQMRIEKESLAGWEKVLRARAETPESQAEMECRQESNLRELDLLVEVCEVLRPVHRQ